MGHRASLDYIYICLYLYLYIYINKGKDKVRRGQCIGSWWGKQRERGYWGDLSVDGWIILGWICGAEGVYRVLVGKPEGKRPLGRRRRRRVDNIRMDL